jgi:hypothetical protein
MSFEKAATCLALFASACSFVACGGGSSNHTTPPPVSGQAQGVYLGSTSDGGQFVGIVEPNDNLYAAYISGASVELSGMIAGTATESSNSFTASIHDFYANGTVNAGTLAGSFVAGTSLTGTVTETNVSITLTGQIIPSTQYNYATAAHLADIAGSWNGSLLDGETADLTVSSAGAISGTSSGGCTFTGTATPNTSGKNFFDVNLTFGASPCLAPNLTVTGVGIVVPATGSSSAQILAAVKASDNSLGTVFLGSTSTAGISERLRLFR